MRYVVVGAGGVGCVIGGRLAEAGCEVALLARGAHGEALRRDGLELGLPDRVLRVRPPVFTSVRDLPLQPQDVLVLAVKSQQTAGVLADLAARPVADGFAADLLPIVCAQNGIDNEPAALRHFAAVHGMCVNLPATFLHPGRVDCEGTPVSGLLDVGRFPTGSDAVDGRLAADLSDSGFVGTVREDVMAWKRAKLVRNLGNALQVLYPEREAVDLGQIIGQARDEAERCFAAAGLAVVAAAEWDAHARDRLQVAPVQGRQRQGGSTWQSVQRGQGTVETDYLNGEIVLLGRLHGVPTPVNADLQRRMRAVLAAG